MLFDQAFRIFFRKRAYLDKLLAAMLPQAPPAAAREAAAGRAARAGGAVLRHGRSASASRREIEVDARLTVSDREVLQKKDFAQMTAAEIAAAKDAIKRLVLLARRGEDTAAGAASPRPPHRPAPHAARQHEGGRRGDRSEISRSAHEAAADRGAARYLRLDEPVHAPVPAFPPCGDRRAQARAHLPVRHAADQRHARAEGARTPTRRSPRARRTSLDWSGGTRIATSLHGIQQAAGRAACSRRARSCC